MLRPPFFVRARKGALRAEKPGVFEGSGHSRSPAEERRLDVNSDGTRRKRRNGALRPVPAGGSPGAFGAARAARVFERRGVRRNLPSLRGFCVRPVEKARKKSGVTEGSGPAAALAERCASF